MLLSSFVGLNIEKIKIAIFGGHYHDRMDGRECNLNWLGAYHADSFYDVFLKIPHSYVSIITCGCQKAISFGSTGAYKFFMALPQIPYNGKLTLLVSFINHDPTVSRTADE